MAELQYQSSHLYIPNDDYEMLIDLLNKSRAVFHDRGFGDLAADLNYLVCQTAIYHQSIALIMPLEKRMGLIETVLDLLTRLAAVYEATEAVRDLPKEYIRVGDQQFTVTNKAKEG